ncbi:MAG: MotA/TolQ/ExbB proton channel family protein [Ignavibacterium sp.]|nr:MotA/TolQ/ExbB proton channel family protein [Ignavibacterium sp.]MCX7611404.1 MotA/TolQ/ExbB proton channel family protein [Ignavibacterium sp.]MDW8375242.1 MotA/TolQ/ExbB proton channel family protein [Ignavibacteriales bacterium]
MDIFANIASILNVIAQATNQGGALNWLVEKFNAGGFFMWPILASLIIGLAFSLERLWSLSRARVNTKEFIIKIKKALDEGGVEAAKKVCENTRGPVASVFYAGLLRYNEGLDAAEKAIMAYGAVEMSFLERGLIWISTFITIAPMLGFTGTVQGMIEAFDAIKEAAQISPAIVASGISVALLTTLFGLVVAMILQIFYNYFVSRIDRLVGDMEQSSIELIDALYELKNK